MGDPPLAEKLLCKNFVKGDPEASGFAPEGNNTRELSKGGETL